MSNQPALNLPPQGVFSDDAGLQRGVRALEDNAGAAVRETDRRKVDKLAVGNSGRVVTSDYSPKLGELVLYDPTAGGFTVRLPKLTRADAGKEITLKRKTSSANVVLVYGHGSDLIDGAIGLGINVGYYSARLIWDGDGWSLN